MAGMGGQPPNTGEADTRAPYAAEEDYGETVAWCPSCEEERRFVKATRDVAAEEEGSAMPDVERAMHGEEGWRCTVCGRFEANLVTDRGYDYQYSDVGYRKRPFQDEEDTTREVASDAVTPPRRGATGAESEPDLEE